MQRIITVKLEDVYPLEDEYGNQYTSRDYSTKANREYVRELAESMRMKGIPDEPISVVEDGGIYRIKTGNSRVMAMRELGTRECPAIVDDDDTVQSVLEAVVRTDTKKKYEPVERSRFVQQLVMFGDDQYVSDVSGIEVSKVKRIRKARMVVDDAGDDMTIDRMLLIEEFSDDPDAVAELSSCSERDAGWIADKHRRLRRKREEKAAFEAAFGLQGVPVAHDLQEVDGMAYFLSVPTPGEVAERLPEEWEKGQVVALVTGTYSGASASIYVSPELGGEDEDKAELRRLEDAYGAAIEAMDEARAAWFWGNLATGKPMTNVLRECGERFLDDHVMTSLDGEITEEAEAAARNKGLSLFDYALGFTGFYSEGHRFARCLARESVEEHWKGSVNGYIDELVMFQADGWEPGEATSLIKRLSELADGKDAESEDEND